MWKNATAILATTLVLGIAACDYDDDDPTGTDETFAATLGPEGSVQTSATGTATFELDGGIVSYVITVSDITDVTAAHIHGPAAASANAGVIVPLFAAPSGGTGDVEGQLVASTFTAADITASGVSMDSLLVLMRNGQSYVNVHTAVNPGGEIRGQITEQ